MDTQKISIVMLNWNDRSVLEKTIPALLKINYPNKEIIVVDNHSTDGSIEFLESFNGLMIIKNKINEGYSKGKNTGVAQASGEYIFLMDNDILIQDPEIFNNLIRIYNKVESPAFLCPCLAELGQEKTIYYKGEYGYFGIKVNKPIPATKLFEFSQDYYQTQLIFGGNIFFAKKVWDQLGGLDDVIPFNLDDNDISIRANYYGYKCYMTVNRPLNIHLGTAKRKDNNLYFWYFKYLLVGHLISYLKNLQLRNFFIIAFFETGIIFIKSIKNAIFRFDIRMIYAFFYSSILFLKLLPKTLKKRKVIQNNRQISARYYFKQKVILKFK